MNNSNPYSGGGHPPGHPHQGSPHPGAPQPGYPQPGYQHPAPGAYGYPSGPPVSGPVYGPPAKKRNSALTLGLVIAGSVALCIVLLVLTREEKGPTVEDIVAAEESKAERKLAQLENVGRKAEKVGKKARRKTLDDEDIDLRRGAVPTSKKNRVVIIQPEDFEDLTRRAMGDPHVCWVHDWARAAELVEDGANTFSSERDATKAFADLESIKYALVVQIDSHEEPTVEDYDFQNRFRYTSGSIEGFALLYRLKGAKLLGGFRFHAKNDDEVSVSDSDGTEADALKGLTDNLESTTREAIRRRFEALVPGGELRI